MEQLPAEQQQPIPVSQTPTVSTPPQINTVNSGNGSQKKYTLLWISVGIIVLAVGIGIGAFIIHPHKNLMQQNSQAVNQNSAPQANPSLVPQSFINMSAYPTVTQSSLPLGDNKYSTTGAKKGYIYLCRVMNGGGGAQASGNWITGTTWNYDTKPHVQGSVSWPNATFSDKVLGNNRVLTGNGLPVGMTTGIFPISTSDPASQYDRNPNSIKQQTLSLTLPVNPTVASTPNCMGGEVGVMTNGVPLFNGFDAEDRDAAAHEIQDSCDGHPEVTSEYHYHSLSSCFKDIKESTVLGFALDGFPITGPVQADGSYLTTDALDECHGTTSTITLDGKQVTMYHYVMTKDFPYSVSCFKGKPVSLQVIKTTGVSGQGQQGGGGPQGGQNNAQNGQKPQPPQAAFTICSGKVTGTSCSFTAPRGTVTGTCQTPPGQTSSVCAPINAEQNQEKSLMGQ